MATGRAEKHGGFVFLVDPHWSTIQREVFAASVREADRVGATKMREGWLCIPTGGSSGGLKFARHDEETLGAAAIGFSSHFSMPRVNAVDVLPPWHVSGLMARVRCAMTGGRHRAWTSKQLEAGSVPDLGNPREWVISLVPTQLHRLMATPSMADWLRSLGLILVGGGPVWPDLIAATRETNLPVVLSYGMTETAAMVAAQLPGEFIAGDASSGRPLPHVRLAICDDAGNDLPPGAEGGVRLAGSSVMRGYFGEKATLGTFETSDSGRVDDTGRLWVSGRRDDLIITGGEKVNPREVEAILRASGCFAELVVLGVPHSGWGEEVVACYVPGPTLFDEARELNLTRHQKPKRYRCIAEADWPRNAQGKVNQAVLRALFG